MTHYKTLLKADPTEWLLEESNPSIRYFALRWLLDKAESDPEVVRASQAIVESESVRRILERLRPEGYWGPDPRPHHGTRGYLLLLMWLGYKGNGGIGRALRYRLDGCIQEDGSYGVDIKGRTVYVPCHAADTLRELVWFGHQDDPRALKILDWLIRIQLEEGGWPCVSKVKTHSCFWATATVLRVLSELPPEWGSQRVGHSCLRAVELFLNSRLYRHHREWGKPSPLWFKFGYSFHVDTDILELLNTLAPYVRPDDERIQEGLSLVLKKQDESGRWPCEKHAKGGKWFQRYVTFEEIGQPSEWVTLRATKMLKTLFGGKN